MAQRLSSLSGLVGKRVVYITRVLYQHGGEIDPVDGPLEIGVDGQVVLLDGAMDGESLRVRDRAWDDPFKEPLTTENLDYVEEHGKWQRVDCSHHKDYEEFVGQVLTEVRLLRNERHRIGGVRLSVHSRSMWFVVEGDECHVHWAHPIGFTEVRG